MWAVIAVSGQVARSSASNGGVGNSWSQYGQFWRRARSVTVPCQVFIRQVSEAPGWPVTAQGRHGIRHCREACSAPPARCAQTKRACSPFGEQAQLSWQRPTLARPFVKLPSALQRFTSVFGMGTGGSTALRSPEAEQGSAALPGAMAVI